jgi:hypothetical protein
MAYNETLADRIRKELADTAGVVEKRMFGGVGFLLHGNMLVGVHKEDLVVRIAPGDTEQALRDANARVFDITGRPMKGWILVSPAGLRGPKLAKWIERVRKDAPWEIGASRATDRSESAASVGHNRGRAANGDRCAPHSS